MPPRVASRVIAHIGGSFTEESREVPPRYAFTPESSGRDVVFQVDRCRSPASDLPRGCLQKSSDRGNQLGGVRLDEVGVRPGEQSRLDVGRGGVAGEDDDGRAGIDGATTASKSDKPSLSLSMSRVSASSSTQRTRLACMCGSLSKLTGRGSRPPGQYAQDYTVCVRGCKCGNTYPASQ